MTVPALLKPIPMLTRWAGVLRWTDDPDRFSHLLPPETCRQIIAEYEAWNVPVGNKVAARIAKVLIGSYPERRVNDPATYSRAIVSVLAEFPVDVGKAAADKVTRELKFLPTRAEVFAALKEMKFEIEHLCRTAERHLTEHERREVEAAAERERAKDPVKPEQWAKLRRTMIKLGKKSPFSLPERRV